MPAILENWFILNDIKSAKLANCRLHGEVYNHDTYPNGNVINTSDVVVTDGPVVSTRSLYSYILGKPDIGFANTLQNLGILYNPADPLGFLK
jgi:hypothetical protein